LPPKKLQNSNKDKIYNIIEGLYEKFEKYIGNPYEYIKNIRKKHTIRKFVKKENMFPEIDNEICNCVVIPYRLKRLDINNEYTIMSGIQKFLNSNNNIILEDEKKNLKNFINSSNLLIDSEEKFLNKKRNNDSKNFYDYNVFNDSTESTN